MKENAHDALATHTRDYQVGRKLHAVPPHVVYEVEFDGVRAVCKVARGPSAGPSTEARVTEFVDECTSVPVPRILAVGDDHFVAEWREDVPDEPTLDEARVRAMGVGLATLHEDAAKHFDATGHLRTEGDDLASDRDGRWSDTLRTLLAERRDYLDVVGYGDVARDAREFVGEHQDLFDAVGDATLVHGNYLPDHVGVSRSADGDADVACVIDFEHALVGPGEWDYMRTALPLFGNPNCDSFDVLRRTFREAYESVRPLPSGFDRRREAYVAFNAVSYLKALHVQRTHLDASNGGAAPPNPLSMDEVARRADGLRTLVREALAALRAEWRE